MDNIVVATVAAILLTLIAHASSRILARKLAWIPMVVTAMGLVIIFLYIVRWDYNDYYDVAKPVFDHLLGYVTVLLAIPLAAMSFKGLPVKKLTLIVLMASVIGALLPMGLAYLFSLSHDTLLAFATRSVTTPIGLSVADLIKAPPIMVNLIIVVSGIMGATMARFLFRGIEDDRAKGLALGLAAHAFWYSRSLADQSYRRTLCCFWPSSKWFSDCCLGTPVYQCAHYFITSSY